MEPPINVGTEGLETVEAGVPYTTPFVLLFEPPQALKAATTISMHITEKKLFIIYS
jgi:hypothetical protein